MGGVRSPLFLSFTNYFFTSLIQDSNHPPLLIGDGESNHIGRFNNFVK